MEIPPKITDESQINNLNVEDINKLMEFYTEEEKDELIPFIKASNEALKEKIAENQIKIEVEQKISNIFLKKMWSALKDDEKHEGAMFFKDIYKSINKI